MTTSSEITATEKLLELIRASSSPEENSPVHVIDTSESRVEHPSSPAELHKNTDPLNRSPTVKTIPTTQETDIVLTLETPDNDDNRADPPPLTEQSRLSETPPAQDTEKLLELIRSSSSASHPDDQITPVTESFSAFGTQALTLQDDADLQDLDATAETPTAEEKSNFTLALENTDSEYKDASSAEELTPPSHPKQPDTSRSNEESLSNETSSSPSPQSKEITPPPTSAAHDNGEDDDDDDDDDVFPLPAPDGHITLDPAPETDRSPSPPPPAPAAISHSFSRFKRLRLRPSTKTTLGIDIRPGVIHLVKSQTNKNGPELLAYESVPYPFEPGADQKNLFDDQEFIAVLARTLARLHTSQDNHEIWCAYPFVTPAALHNITIPKVADNNLATAVFWSAKRELEFDDTTTIFDYTPLQEITEANQVKTQALVMLSPRPEVEGVKKMFKKTGFPLTGLSFPAAAVQNYLHHDPSIPTDKPVVYFTIRKEYSFINLFYQEKIFFSRVIKTGVDSFVESLLEQAQSQSILIDEENAKEYLFRSGNSNVGSILNKDDDTLAQLFDWEKLSVIGRLARQLVRTFEYCSTAFKVPPVGALITSGEFTVTDAILKSIENRVGIKCSVIEPLSPTIFHRESLFSLTSNPGLLVAAGLSLSDKQSTANVLFTYADRARELSSNKVNTIISIASIILALGLGTTFVWQYDKELNKKNEVSLLQQKLERHFLAEPRSRNTEYLSQTVQKITQFHHDNKEKTKRFKSVVMVSELLKTLEQEIALTELILNLNQQEDESAGQESPSPDGSMTINGFINAPVENQEFILMNFLKRLDQLTTLGSPILQSKIKASLRNQDVLRFEIRLKTTLSFLDPPAP